MKVPLRRRTIKSPVTMMSALKKMPKMGDHAGRLEEGLSDLLRCVKSNTIARYWTTRIFTTTTTTTTTTSTTITTTTTATATTTT